MSPRSKNCGKEKKARSRAGSHSTEATWAFIPLGKVRRGSLLLWQWKSMSILPRFTSLPTTAPDIWRCLPIWLTNYGTKKTKSRTIPVKFLVHFGFLLLSLFSLSAVWTYWLLLILHQTPKIWQ